MSLSEDPDVCVPACRKSKQGEDRKSKQGGDSGFDYLLLHICVGSGDLRQARILRGKVKLQRPVL